MIYDKLKKKVKILYWKVRYKDRIDIPWNLSFRKNFIINISKGGYLKIGKECFFNNYCTINCKERIEIGNRNIFGENVKLYDHNHVFNKEEFDLQEFKTEKIKIGEENWFGTGVIILKGTEIRNRNVISAGTVLKGNIDSFSVVKSKEKLEIIPINIKK